MMRIDELAIRLPAGFAGRAEHIARLVARELAAIHPPPASRALHALRVAPIVAEPGVSDAVLARRIAGSIAAAVREGRRQGGA